MDPKKKALLVGDQADAPWHPLEPAKQQLEAILAASFDITATVEYDRFAELTKENYDLCISYTDCWNKDVTSSQAAGLMQYVAGGGSLLVIHNGISIQNRYELFQMVGGKFVEHPPFQPLQYFVSNPNHPLAQGVEDFGVEEEPYFFEFDPITPRNVFLEYEFEGKRYPAAWEHAYGLGRVVYLQPGHHGPSFDPPAYRKLVLNAALWLTEGAE